jgi:hypothetical protein
VIITLLSWSNKPTEFEACSMHGRKHKFYKILFAKSKSKATR